MFTERVRPGAAASEEEYMREEKEAKKREERNEYAFRSGGRCCTASSSLAPPYYALRHPSSNCVRSTLTSPPRLTAASSHSELEPSYLSWSIDGTENFAQTQNRKENDVHRTMPEGSLICPREAY